MKTAGELLREARTERGLSLSEASAMTRISRTMLSHLEQGRYDEFTAEVFVRGHLRNYARELGIPSEPVLQAYERSLDGASSVSATRRVPAKAKDTTQKKPKDSGSVRAKLPKFRKEWMESVGPTQMLAVALVLIGVVVFVGLLAGGNRATAKDPAQFPTDSQEEWEIEQDVEETRWLLEQPVQRSSDQDVSH